MAQDKPPSSLKDFDARLRAARDRERLSADDDSGQEVPRGPLGLAFRIGVELVAALAVGVGIGYGLDFWLGTKPWLMIVFFFLGAGAGILNVYRAVNALGFGGEMPGKNDRNQPHGGGAPSDEGK
jgi:ATP synthase protein I